MRKRIVELGADAGWLNLTEIATVEAVFNAGCSGWRAVGAGEQLIRILFDEPVALTRIRLRFEEPERQRTQEFALSWCPAADGCREIVRQQWNFSPSGSAMEIEDYAVNLESVSALELRIWPEIAGGDALATLARWQIAGRR